MGQVAPIYTVENTRFAWQLIWSLTVFWRCPPKADEWLEPLRNILETDGIRLLAHRIEMLERLDRSQFLISTRPQVKPNDVAQRVKGRLQFLIRDRQPKAFYRNYDLHSIGSTTRSKAENYVASQLEHHDVAQQVEVALTDLQVINPEVNLAQPRFTSHSRFRCNLHLVMECNEHRNLSADEALAVREMIRRAAVTKGHLLSRFGILEDHMHLVFGIGFAEAPSDVALSYLNNAAFALAMKPAFRFSCWIGTVGEYDLGAIPETAWLPKRE